MSAEKLRPLGEPTLAERTIWTIEIVLALALLIAAADAIVYLFVSESRSPAEEAKRHASAVDGADRWASGRFDRPRITCAAVSCGAFSCSVSGQWETPIVLKRDPDKPVEARCWQPLPGGEIR